MTKTLHIPVALTLAFGVTSASFAVTIYSNNPAGDSFTNPTSTNMGQAVGATNWFYNNVRNNGVVGINSTLPRSGLGSAQLVSAQGPGGASSKADIEYINFSNPGNATSPIVSMGSLGSLNSLGYEWYRGAGGAASAWQHPVLRLYVDADGNMGTTNDRGYLVFERAYNQGTGAVPTNQWITEDLFTYNSGAGANMWQVAFGVGNFDTAGNWQTLSTWQSVNGFTPTPNGRTFNANSAVYGISFGVGSGWGTLSGAIDNVRIGFAGGASETYNFEVVPEPASMAVLGIGALALLRRRRKA